MNEIKDTVNTNADETDDNKVLIDALTSGWRGVLLIADTPTEDGFYTAGESGTYTNAGSVVVDLTVGITYINVSGTQTVFSTTVIPVEVPLNGVVETGDVEATTGDTVSRALDNYPIKRTGLQTTVANGLPINDAKGFFIDLYLNGVRDVSKTYSAFIVERNLVGVWRIYILGKPTGAAVEICQFRTTINPENGDNITYHNLDELASSGVTGTIAVNWSKVTSGVSYYNMYESGGYGFEEKVWDKSNAILINQDELPEASKIITTDELTLNDIVLKDENLETSNYKFNPISYKHPRGDSEYVGNGNLAGLDGANIVLEPLGHKLLVKQVKAKMYSSDFVGTIAIYKNTAYNIDNADNNLVESFPISLGEFNTDSNGYQIITLTNDLILEENEYLYFYALATSGTLTMIRWNVDSGSEPFRQRLIYIYLGNWTTGNPSYLATPPLVISDITDIDALADDIEALSIEVAQKADDEVIIPNLPDKIF